MVVAVSDCVCSCCHHHCFCSLVSSRLLLLLTQPPSFMWFAPTGSFRMRTHIAVHTHTHLPGPQIINKSSLHLLSSTRTCFYPLPYRQNNTNIKTQHRHHKTPSYITSPTRQQKQTNTALFPPQCIHLQTKKTLHWGQNTL